MEMVCDGDARAFEVIFDRHLRAGLLTRLPDVRPGVPLPRTLFRRRFYRSGAASGNTTAREEASVHGCSRLYTTA